MGDLRARWLSLWARIKAQGDGAAVYDTVLLPAYSEPHRRYHTMQHIRRCLVELNEVHDYVAWHDAVEMALWFHDVIYHVGQPNNEYQSGSVANQVMQEAKLPMQFRLEVTRHIDATDHQQNRPAYGSVDRSVVVDIDLAVLGYTQHYDEYRDQTRQEYHEVPDDIFYPGRVKMLDLFLTRPLVYHTEHFQDQYEVQARRNMVRELTEISGKTK